MTTSWVRPESRRSIAAASASDAGLPRIASPHTTTVSAPSTGRSSRAATAAALARASRSAAAAPLRPAGGLPPLPIRRRDAARPGSARMRARRGEAEARTTRAPGAPTRGGTGSRRAQSIGSGPSCLETNSSAPCTVRASRWLAMGARVYRTMGMSTHCMVALIMLMTSFPAIVPAMSSSITITSGLSSAMAARAARPSTALRNGISALSRAASVGSAGLGVVVDEQHRLAPAGAHGRRSPAGRSSWATSKPGRSPAARSSPRASRASISSWERRRACTSAISASRLAPCCARRRETSPRTHAALPAARAGRGARRRRPAAAPAAGA